MANLATPHNHHKNTGFGIVFAIAGMSFTGRLYMLRAQPTFALKALQMFDHNVKVNVTNVTKIQMVPNRI